MDKRSRVSGKPKPKEDRRKARSRQALSDAFVALVMEKGYDKVSILDIVQRANVGRSTFYEHFENKEQLMLWGHDHLKELILEGAQPSPAGAPRLRFLGLYAHLREIGDFAAVLGNGKAGEIISGFLRDTLRRNLEAQAAAGKTRGARAGASLLAEAAAAGLVAVLWRWVRDGMKDSPQAMADFCDGYLERVFATKRG